MNKPTDQQIKEAFIRTADTIVDDSFRLAQEEGECTPGDGEFCLDRETVADYLAVYGGPHGKAVEDWVMNLTPEDFTKELDAAGVPQDWRE